MNESTLSQRQSGLRQIALDLRRIEDPTLENFLPGRNEEALACLRELRDAPAGSTTPARLIHLWGEPGCGRTHLARSMTGGGTMLDASAPPGAFETAIASCSAPPGERLRVIALTGVEKLDDARQIQAFQLINHVRERTDLALLTTGAQAPMALPLRAELRTRLGAGIVFRLHLLDDDDKMRAIEQVAQQRGVRVAPGVLRWLLRHTSRDIRALIQLFDDLDRHAYERQRAITLPLLRGWLENAAARPLHPAPSSAGNDGRRANPPQPVPRPTSIPDLRSNVIMPTVQHIPPSVADPAPSDAHAPRALCGLALFDLDQTLLPIDSDFEWGRFLVGIGAVDADEYERRNRFFFDQYHAGTLDIAEFLAFQLAPLAAYPAERLDGWRARFLDEIIRPKILEPARALVERHRAQGDLCAIVTATNEFVTRPIAAEFGIEHLIATGVEIVDGRYTGRPSGTPSFRAGKVERTSEWLDSLGKTWDGFARTWFYSDSLNDLPLLERVSHPIATNPDPQLAALARQRGWRTLQLFE